MSFIVLYATDNGAIIKSDGRMCNDKKDIVFEDYYKVCKIKDNIIMGYSGGLEFDLNVIAETLFKTNGQCDITEYASILKEKIIANVRKKCTKIVGGSFLVAGIENGEVKVYIARCNNKLFEDGFVEGFNITKLFIFASGTCDGDKEPAIFAKEVFLQSNGTVEERLNKVIYKALEVSRYVNKKISTVRIGEGII